MQPLRQLAMIRRAVHLSQAQLADRAGFVQQYISMLERGLLPTDESHVLRLAGVLGVDPGALTAAQITIDCSSVTSTVTVKASQ